MIVIGAFQFIMGSTGNFTAIVLCIIIVGATISFWHPPAIAALSQRFAHRRGLAISMHGTGGSIGEALGPVCVGALLAVMTWQGVLQFSLVPALIAGGAVWILTRNIQASGASTLTMATYGASLRNLTRSPALRTVMLVTAIAAMATGAFVTFLPIYLRIDLGYSPAEASAFIFASQVAGIASQPVMGQLSDRFGRIQVVVPSLLVLATGILAVSVAPAGWPLAAAVAMVGVFQFPSIALFLAAAMDHVGSETQAITVSLVYGASFLASSFSPSIAGRLADSLGITSVFVFAGLLALLATVVLALRHTSLRLPGR
jgi:MFS family permease